MNATQHRAAVDFLKGISLGDTQKASTTKRTHRSSHQHHPPIRPKPLPLGKELTITHESASSKKIKIDDYHAQTAPGRISFATTTKCTIALFSLIKYDAKAAKKDKKQDVQNTMKENMNPTTALGKNKAISYAHLLNSSWVAPEEIGSNPDTPTYDPYILDDPSLTTGKHRTVMNLPSFRESIIPFVKPGVIKDELNELFKEKHPWIQTGVSLHKLRKLKKRLVDIAVAEGLEISTVALAYVLFEKLIMKNVVSKTSIRLHGATCLLLAAKMNDPRNDDLKTVVETIEKQLEVTGKELVQAEFPVFVALSFGAFLNPLEVKPHFNRIIKDYTELFPPTEPLHM